MLKAVSLGKVFEDEIARNTLLNTDEFIWTSYAVYADFGLSGAPRELVQRPRSYSQVSPTPPQSHSRPHEKTEERCVNSHFVFSVVQKVVCTYQQLLFSVFTMHKVDVLRCTVRKYRERYVFTSDLYCTTSSNVVFANLSHF